jgi:hypothetical protein
MHYPLNPKNMKIPYIILCMTVSLLSNASNLQTKDNPFNVIDAYMRNCPGASEKTIADIASYINRSARTDLEKARAVYIWMTDNILYNDAGFNSGKLGDNSAENVLKTRVAVCAGFANLFTEIAAKTGIEAITISGYAKGFGYSEGDSFDESNHAWNAVKIEGSWRIYDATWGQGSATEDSRGKLKSIKAFDETWFNVDPKHSIFTHLSEIPYQNFLSQNISLVEFERLPSLNPSAFELGWLTAEELLTQVKTKKAFNLPEIHALNTSFQILNAPKTKQLKIKEKVRFELSFQEDLHFHLVNSLDEWIPFEKTENGSSINFIPFDAGEIKIMLELKDGAIPILTYDTK